MRDVPQVQRKKLRDARGSEHPESRQRRTPRSDVHHAPTRSRAYEDGARALDHALRPRRRRAEGRSSSGRPLRRPSRAGTVEHAVVTFGPYTVPPGHDMNRVDLDLPPHNGFMLSVEPQMRRVTDSPSRRTWRRTSTTRTGSRSTPATRRTTTSAATPSGSSATATRRPRATSSERSAADPNGPVYGAVHRARQPAADDLHAAQQDGGAAQRLHRPRRRRSRTARPRSSRRSDEPRAPRRHRRAVRPRRSTSRASPTATASGRTPSDQEQADRVDLDRSTARSSAWAATCTRAARA